LNIRKWQRLTGGMALAAMSFVGTALAEPEAAETDASLRTEVAQLRDRLARLEELLNSQQATAEQQAPAEQTEQSEIDAAYAEGRTLVLPSAPTEAQSDDDVAVGIVSTGGPELSFTGLVDTYYSYNTNKPEDGTNSLYYTNPNARGFGLNQAKLEFDANTGTGVGFRSDIWFGSGARLFRDGLEEGPLEDVIYLQQAYGYYEFENGSELDVGLFGTIAGLEVAESHLNWNYSRGLLWAWNEPFSHLGAKFSTPITDTFTTTVMLVNGFDNAFDANQGKSYGVQGSWAPSDRFNTTATWIHGPENGLGESGWQRDFSWNFYGGLHEKFEIMANLDWIANTDPTDVTATSWGIGGYARFNATDKFRIAQRYEYFEDSEARSTGVEQILKEYTLTFEYAPEPRFITRFEWRRDWSTVPFFGCPECGGPTAGFNTDQNTFTAGMMFILGPSE
jgi:hypothetical protein